MRIHVDPYRPAPRKLEQALSALQKGEVIIYPTDTGYAFGCCLSSTKGIAQLRRLKKIRERDRKPLTMLVRDLSQLGYYGCVGNRNFRLIRRILPGPFTIVIRATDNVPRAMYNRHREVGLRIPDHPLCQMLVEQLNEPLLTSSVTNLDAEANGLQEPDALERIYAREVTVVLDSGPLWPDPSTVLRLMNDEVEVVRIGQGELPS